MGFRWSEGEFGIKLLAPEPCSEFYRLGILYIPKGAQVYESEGSNLLTHLKPHKCRAEKAVVLDMAIVRPLKGHHGNCHFANGVRTSESMYKARFGDATLVYHNGCVVTPKEPFYEGECECASGIHYYRTPKDLCESYLSDIVLYGMDSLDEPLVNADGVPIEEKIDNWFQNVCEAFSPDLESDDNYDPQYPNPQEI